MLIQNLFNYSKLQHLISPQNFNLITKTLRSYIIENFTNPCKFHDKSNQLHRKRQKIKKKKERKINISRNHNNPPQTQRTRFQKMNLFPRHPAEARQPARPAACSSS